MNETNLSLDHGLHSGEWDPSTSDGTDIVCYHVRQALVAIDFLFARARADNRTTDSASAPAERDQATQPTSGATRRGWATNHQIISQHYKAHRQRRFRRCGGAAEMPKSSRTTKACTSIVDLDLKSIDSVSG